MHRQNLRCGGAIGSNQGSQRSHGYGRVGVDHMVLALSRFARYVARVKNDVRRIWREIFLTIRTVPTNVQTQLVVGSYISRTSGTWSH